jgi:hypothetical protein
MNKDKPIQTGKVLVRRISILSPGIVSKDPL